MKTEQSLVIDDHQRKCAETRVLPYGGGGNLIVGRQSYEQEMQFRRARISEGVHYELPTWESLEVYQVAE